MLVKIKSILGDAELQKIQKLLKNAKFRDGHLSAGMAAQQVKNNLEVSDEDITSSLNNIVMNNVLRQPIYQQAALPHRIAAPFYARYETGMEYGEHIDDPIMGQGDRYRSDLAMTIFLNSPDEYEGGELIIQSSYGEQSLKLNAGDAVLYPATTRHRVAKVTSGQRLVAVTWVQSLIRDNEQRELLYQLSKTREKWLHKDPDSEDTKRIDSTYVNLVRMWSEV
ncbi:MAG: Fe2+-dependent dioxygenase [Gammaproteobacteria bacterium]|nr:MAG: Fe2+-dependent dioxygenase [Gammaproteobacteria bacterium]